MADGLRPPGGSASPAGAREWAHSPAVGQGGKTSLAGMGKVVTLNFRAARPLSDALTPVSALNCVLLSIKLGQIIKIFILNRR